MNDSRLNHLLASLTFEEKVGQMIQLTGDFFSVNEAIMDTGPMKKLGLNKTFDPYQIGSVLNITDGHNVYQLQKQYLEKSSHKIPLLFMADIIYGYKSIFPIPIAQACSWNFELIEKSAKVMAKECYEAGIHVTFSPMVDIVRDPRWGRVMEAPGEDVLLAKRYAKAMVQGIQGTDEKIGENHIAACVKHFAAYGAPTAGREYNSVELSEESLHNVYLPSYKAAIDAGVRLVMTAFNTLNGIPCTGNQWLNKEILRKSYEFNGVLISDYAAVEELKYHGYTANDAESAQKAIESTVDIDMKTAVYANQLAKLSETNSEIVPLVDAAAYRVLKLKNDLGLFEDPYRGLPVESAKIKRTHEKQAAMSELARESVVLLKNNGLLPLKQKKIGLIGPYASEHSVLGFWAITGDEQEAIALDEGLAVHSQEANLDWQIQTALGTSMVPREDIYRFGKYADRFTPEERSMTELLNEACDVAGSSEVLLLAVGESAFQSGEGGSRVNPSLPKHQVTLIKEMKKLGKPIVLIVFGGRPLLLDEIIEDVDAVIYAWFQGSMSGKVLAEILSGAVNPSGRLAMTFPKVVGQIPIYYSETATGRPNDKIEQYHRFASRYLDESNHPLYPFGYGLSYSEISYDSLELDAAEQQLSIRIHNHSNRPTKEVVQLYVRDHAASFVRPVKELRDFKKELLQPNESKIVTFELTDELFAFLDNQGNRLLETGEFTLSIGQHSADNRFQVTIAKDF